MEPAAGLEIFREWTATQNLTFVLLDFTVEIELPGFQHVTEKTVEKELRSL
jgi:hypothetical protein